MQPNNEPSTSFSSSTYDENENFLSSSAWNSNSGESDVDDEEWSDGPDVIDRSAGFDPLITAESRHHENNNSGHPAGSLSSSTAIRHLRLLQQSPSTTPTTISTAVPSAARFLCPNFWWTKESQQQSHHHLISTTTTTTKELVAAKWTESKSHSSRPPLSSYHYHHYLFHLLLLLLLFCPNCCVLTAVAHGSSSSKQQPPQRILSPREKPQITPYIMPTVAMDGLGENKCQGHAMERQESGLSGYILSHQPYHRPYPKAKKNCFLILNAPKGYRIRLSVMEFKVSGEASSGTQQCEKDSLHLFDNVHMEEGHSSPQLVPGPIMGQFCGHIKNGTILGTSSENIMSLWWHTDDDLPPNEQHQGRGFRLRWTFFQDSCPASPAESRDKFRCNNGECIASELGCDKVPHCFDRSDTIKSRQSTQLNCYNPVFNDGETLLNLSDAAMAGIVIAAIVGSVLFCVAFLICWRDSKLHRGGGDRPANSISGAASNKPHQHQNLLTPAIARGGGGLHPNENSRAGDASLMLDRGGIGNGGSSNGGNDGSLLLNGSRNNTTVGGGSSATTTSNNGNLPSQHHQQQQQQEQYLKAVAVAGRNGDLLTNSSGGSPTYAKVANNNSSSSNNNGGFPVGIGSHQHIQQQQPMLIPPPNTAADKEPLHHQPQHHQHQQQQQFYHHQNTPLVPPSLPQQNNNGGHQTSPHYNDYQFHH